MIRGLLRGGGLAAVLVLVLAPGARAADPPPPVSAPSALVVEGSTADVAYALSLIHI